MRVMVIAMGFAALAGLSGCDQVSPPKLASNQQALPPCHCVPAAPEEHLARLPAPVERYRHHYRRYARSYYSSHSYSQSWAREYEEQDYSSSYASQSRSYYQGDEDRDDYSRERDEGWVDGYGRRHYGEATRVVADSRERLDPWHAYDKHCPEHPGDDE